MRVIVTGASGFIGRKLCELLSENGHRVVPLLREQADIMNVEDLLARGAGKADALVHLAFVADPQIRRREPLLALRIAACGTANALQLASASSASHFVLASSGKVYGNATRMPVAESAPKAPTTFLGRLKVTQEEIAAAGVAPGLAVTALRLFNVYGHGQEGDFLIPKVVSGLLQGQKKLRLGELKHRRDWIHVDDACKAFLVSIENPAEPGAFRTLNAASGRSASAGEIIAILGRASGMNPAIEQDPGLLRPDEVGEECADISSLQGLGFRPRVGLEEGLERVWKAAMATSRHLRK